MSRASGGEAQICKNKPRRENRQRHMALHSQETMEVIKTDGLVMRCRCGTELGRGKTGQNIIKPRDVPRMSANGLQRVVGGFICPLLWILFLPPINGQILRLGASPNSSSKNTNSDDLRRNSRIKSFVQKLLTVSNKMH